MITKSEDSDQWPLVRGRKLGISGQSGMINFGTAKQLNL